MRGAGKVNREHFRRLTARAIIALVVASCGYASSLFAPAGSVPIGGIKPAHATGLVSDVLGSVVTPHPITDSTASAAPGYKYIGCMVASAVDKGATFNTIAAIEHFVIGLWPSSASTTATQCKSAVDANQAQADLSLVPDYSVVGDVVAASADWTVYQGGCQLPGISGGPGDGLTSGSNPCAVANVPAGTNADQMPAIRYASSNQEGAYYAPNDWMAGMVTDSSGVTAQWRSYEWPNGSIGTIGTTPYNHIGNVGASTAAASWAGCGGSFGNVCDNGIPAGTRWDDIETFGDSGGTQFCTLIAVGATSPAGCVTVGALRVAIGGQYPSDANCGSASCVHTDQRQVISSLLPTMFGRVKCLRDGTACDTINNHPGATPSNAPPTVPTPSLSCVLQVNVTVPGTFGSGATCPTGAGTNIQINLPKLTPPQATGQATEGTLQALLTQVIQLPVAIGKSIGGLLPKLPDFDYWRNKLIEWYGTGDWVPGWVSYWRDRVVYAIEHLPSPSIVWDGMLAPMKTAIEGCWLSDGIGEPCDQFDWGTIYRPVNAELVTTAPFPFSMPHDLDHMMQPFEASPASPTIFDQWIRALPCDFCASGYSYNEHVYVNFDKFCLNNNGSPDDGCILLFGVLLPGGVSLISLIRVAEVVLICLVLFGWFRPKPVVEAS